MKRILLLSMLSCSLLLATSCIKLKVNSAPNEISTYIPYIYSGNTAFCGGELVASSESELNDFGICWSESSMPTIDDNFYSAWDDYSRVDDYFIFSYLIEDLEPNTRYHVRTFEIMSDGKCYYGKTMAFLTGATWEGDYYRTFDVNGVSFRMVYVQGDSFIMGAQNTDPLGNNYDPDAQDSESPVHYVNLSPYCIGETLVTQQLWSAVMGSNPSNSQGARLPVESVSWSNIVDNFIPRLNAITGMKFRLPTEAEWEFAARGVNQGLHFNYAGSNYVNEVAWYDGNSNLHTQNVGQLKPNERGLYDMSGNVWEWCSDWINYYSSSTQQDPTGSYNSANPGRVVRGGAVNYDYTECRITRRRWADPEDKFATVGFRLVCNP